MLVEVDYRKYAKACVLDTSVSPVSAWPRGMGVSPVEAGASAGGWRCENRVREMLSIHGGLASKAPEVSATKKPSSLTASLFGIQVDFMDAFFKWWS